MPSQPFPTSYRDDFTPEQAQALAEARDLARLRWGSATPFRMGIVSYEIDIPNPYPQHTRNHALFAEGRRCAINAAGR